MTYLMPADDRERFVELKRKNLPFDEQDMKLAMIWCDHTRRNAVRQHPSLELWAMMIAECRLEMGWNSETMAMLFEFARSNPTHFLFDLTVTPKLLMSTWKNGMTLAENLKSQFIQSKKGKEMLTRHQIRNIDYSKPI